MNSSNGDGFLILGASGQLGYELVKLLPNAQVATHGAAKNESFNMEDPEALRKLISRIHPTIIINAAAKTNVDLCEIEKISAFQINALAPRYIAESAREQGSLLVHVSTDYVFDGDRGKYNENDIPNPINFYGLSKLVGDTYVQGYSNSLVVRTSGVYGGKNNFPMFVYNKLKKGERIQVLKGYYSPIHAENLALAVKKLIQENVKGIINVAGQRVSRLNLAREIALRFNLDDSLINEIDSLDNFKARRPIDSSLDIVKARSLLKSDFFSIESNLRRFEDSVECFSK